MSHPVNFKASGRRMGHPQHLAMFRYNWDVLRKNQVRMVIQWMGREMKVFLMVLDRSK